MTKPPPPARLFVLLARQASIGVILRRGPSDWVQMIKWHTDTETLEQGQWFKGRVYENKCDLSPDGNLFVYFVFKGSREKYGYAWTAISRPPYFAPLALWTEYGTVGGGGSFIDNQTVNLHRKGGDFHPEYPPQGLTIFDMSNPVSMPQDAKRIESPQWQWVSRGIDDYEEYKAFVASKGKIDSVDDWFQLSDREKGGKKENWYTRYYIPSIDTKQVKKYILERRYFGYRSGKGKLEKYSVVNDQTGEKTLLSDVTWADFDQQGRLVLAKEGKLFSAALQNGDLSLNELADFNANKPDPQPAPDWATKW